MAIMKTLTVGGQTYVVQDPAAVSFEQPQELSPQQQTQAQSNLGIWSNKDIADRLCPAFTESGGVVVCQPVEDYPLEAVSRIVPAQSGSGDPSPDNIRPITGHTAVKLIRCGKNLCPHQSSDERNSAGHIDIYSVFAGNALSGRILTLSADITRQDTTVEEAGTMRFYIYYTDGERTAGAATYGAEKDGKPHKKTITLTADGAKTISYIRLIPVSNSVEGDRADNIQIELGETASAYEPYRGDTFALDLGQTVYGGSLDWATGLLTVNTKKVILTGDESWDILKNNPNGTVFATYSIGGFAKKSDNYIKNYFGVSSHFVKSDYALSGSSPGNSFYWATETGYLRVVYGLPNGGTTADEFSQFLAEQYANGTPVEIVAQIENPLTIQLTAYEITALSGINTLYSDTGDTEVTGRLDPAAVIEKLTNAILSLGGNV